MTLPTFRLCRFLALAFLLWSAGSAAVGGEWTRFRGPNGTGVADDPDVPLAWSNLDEVLRWKVEIPGGGHACPVVSQGHVFIHTASATGDSRSLLAYRLSDGKLLWQNSISAVKGHTHKFSSLASGTPAIALGRVIVPYWNGKNLQLTAYDFTGAQSWNYDVGPLVTQHGAGHSPLVVNGIVYFANDQDDKSHVLALQADTGKLVWKTDRLNRDGVASYSTPFLIPGAGQSQELVVLNTVGLGGYDLATGKELWKSAKGFSFRTVGSAVYNDGWIIAGTGNGGGARHAIAFRLNRESQPPEVTIAWEDRKTFPYVPSPLTRGDRVYFVSDRGIAGCYKLQTGEQVWQERLGDTVMSSPLLVRGNILAVTRSGDVVAFPAADKFQLVGRSSLGADEDVSATPAVVDNLLLIRGRQHLYCLGKRSAP